MPPFFIPGTTLKMSPVLHNPLTHPTHHLTIKPHITTHLKATKFHLFYNPSNPIQPNCKLPTNWPIKAYKFSSLEQYQRPNSSQSTNWSIKAYNSSSFEEYQRPNKGFSFDDFLTAVESILVVSSLVVSVGCVANWVLFKQQTLRVLEVGSRVLVFLLAGAVGVGSLIRSRQWRRVCGVPTSKRLDNGDGSGNVVERIEKLEESVKSANTISRMMARQLEKLGVRFRLHRKALKDPIAETAALAQKNSEATRALAAQADILEKELSEVQKFLLAMQICQEPEDIDQQQKQVDLILAIAKSGKLVDTTKQEAPSQGQVLDDKSSAEKNSRQVDGQPIQALPGHKIATNDVAL